MKKIILLSVLTACLLLSSCGGTYVREEGDSDLTVKIMNSIKDEDRDCRKLDFDKYIFNSLFEGQIEYHESVMPIANPDGTIDPIALMYKAEKIISVQSATLKITYEKGKDWDLQDGKLVIPNGSSIPLVDYEYYYPTTFIQDHTFAKTNDTTKYVRLFYAPDAHKRQIVVNYIHEGQYDGPVPANKGKKLPNFWKKVKSGEKTTVLWYGDSITEGGDSSGRHRVAPYLPIYPDLVDQALMKLNKEADFNFINTALGGMTLPWGVENAAERVVAYNPDLVILAWGMNTAGQNVEQYEASMRELINIIRTANPNCDIVMVAPMLPNPEATLFNGYQYAYYQALENIEKTVERTAMANMTEVHAHLLTKKRFADMTGNNINHCNDYLTRWYAQTLLRTILEK